MKVIKLNNKEGVPVEWTREKIEERIINDDNSFYKALIRVYNYQTFDEKISHETRHSNGLGFNGLDAEFLTSISIQYLKTGRLTPKQIQFGKKKLVKYSGQIFDWMLMQYEDFVVERRSYNKITIPATQLEIWA